MHMRFCLGILLLSSTLGAQVFSPAPWLSSQESQTMSREGFLQRAAVSLRELPLLSKLPWRTQILGRMAGMEPNVCVEGLFWLPLNNMALPEAQLRFFQVSQSISRMKGMEYFSRSRNAREVLVLDSYRIFSLQNRQKAPDQGITALPSDSLVYLMQKDNTFGENIYELKAVNSSSQTTLILSNSEKLYWGILPLVDPGRLRMIIMADFRSDGVLIYGISGAQTFSLFGIERSKEESFFNRLKALADWMKESF